MSERSYHGATSRSLEREIAQWVHPMKDRSDDPSHHERTLLPRSYISLLGTRNSSMGPPHEGSIRRPIAPWANALTFAAGGRDDRHGEVHRHRQQVRGHLLRGPVPGGERRVPDRGRRQAGHHGDDDAGTVRGVHGRHPAEHRDAEDEDEEGEGEHPRQRQQDGHAHQR